MNKSVYFTSLEIENVRCFGDRQELDLTVNGHRPAQWTMMLGDNGVGKTTLLQCLTWMRLEPIFGPGEPAIHSILFDQDNEFLERLLPVG
jgi:predicted ATPase